jgi:phenylpyruvate tautomerase PptA (4-oxalocrotonate tautomerase family)
MPLYRCNLLPGLTTFEQRAEISDAIVHVHCSVTGAPPTFVHAFFAESKEGELPEGKSAFVLGTIRAGRSPEQKQQIHSEIAEAVAKATGLSDNEIGVMTADVPAKWIMEGGELLPEPGEEAEWRKRHAH